MVNKFTLVVFCLILVVLSGCAVSKEKVEKLETRVTTAEERIMILEDQISSMDVSSVHIINEHIQALNNRLNNLEGKSGNNSFNPEPVHVTPVEQIRGSIMDDEINTLYNEGRRLYESRDYPGSIRLLTQVSQQSPNHELSANALYWIGECYYALADFSAARLSFQKVQDTYPSSSKYIDSQLKIAMTWIKQNNKSNARTILLSIKRDHPSYERMIIVDQQLKLTE
jgi:TolA-binding protein